MSKNCEHCGRFLVQFDNSYLGEDGWVEDEGSYCTNNNCKGKLEVQEDE